MTYYKKIKSYSINMLKYEIENTKEILKIDSDKNIQSKLNLLQNELNKRCQNV